VICNLDCEVDVFMHAPNFNLKRSDACFREWGVESFVLIPKHRIVVVLNIEGDLFVYLRSLLSKL
jgi:hypothetical protein